MSARVRLLGASLGAALLLVPVLAGCTAVGPVPGSTRVNGRLLLTHPASRDTADALGIGALGSNAKGCVTIGKNVLVVPEGSKLNADGSVVIDGKSYAIGDQLRLGGGAGSAPAGSDCGATATYFWS